ncbi:hypothetical protein Btru_020806 [Bulinus truncatus]|nr:hypothetical protein Btru_020806 [Bulinus truncatus]
MDCTIPYHPGLLLGRSVDLKGRLTIGYMLVGDEVKPVNQTVRLTTSQFTFVHSFKDVCEILSIPPEYVLKVKSRKITNEMVSACLEAIGDRESSFAVIFKTSFLQQKPYLPPGAVSGRTGHADKTDQTNVVNKSLLSEALADLDSVNLNKSIQDFGSHWVRALEIGNELIIVMRISSDDSEQLGKLHSKISTCLQCHRGLLDLGKMQSLIHFAKEVDKKLTKKHYKDVRLDIKYCFFNELPKYPSSLTGMAKTIETFMDQCIGWTENNMYADDYHLESCVMTVKTGSDPDDKTSMTENLKSAFLSLVTGNQTEQNVEYHRSTEGVEEFESVENRSHDSFVVLESKNSHKFYPLRTTLQTFDAETDFDDVRSLSSLALSQFPENTYNLLERIYKVLCNCDEAIILIEKFLRSKHFMDDVRVVEGNAVLRKIQTVHLAVHDAVHNLDLVSLPSEGSLEDVLNVDPLEIVSSFIENVTSKLPPGGDLDLLMIGKTGHGKSSTGNSILGQEKFVSSSDGNSVTKQTSVGWVEVDGRTIKVVDTPGVCDTSLNTDDDSIQLAIQSISDAIANCPEGFHALLLIIRFGIRMTTEEKKAIGLLKCVLGEDVIRSNCICVITYGDNFDKEMSKSKTTFGEWCRNQQGFLGELFQECNYRCVLFNNMAEDEKAKKSQLIELVNKADTLKGNGTRYTNAIFQFAQRERQKVIAEKHVPQVSEDMVRDIQMIIEYLNSMIGNTSQQQYKEELNRLKERVDNLSNRVTEADTGQFGCLVDTVFSLAATIHSKMDEIADRSDPDSPDEDSKAAVNTNDQDIARDVNSPSDITLLDRFRGELQGYYDTEISPQNSMVNEIVSERVKEQVSKEHQCFPGDSSVCLASGEWIPIMQLKLGDQVLTRNDKGHLHYDTVYMFGHQDFELSSEFVVLETASNKIHLSENHYIYCERHGEEKCIAAKDINVGDNLFLLAESCLVKTAVIRIGSERKRGLFAPFTNSGTIVVDGFLTSCYVNVLQNETCHHLLWPIRHLYKLSPSTLAYINGSSSKQPIPKWAKAFTKLK